MKAKLNLIIKIQAFENINLIIIKPIIRVFDWYVYSVKH